tara:strand:+ start:1433 stop:1684 length:252 start_codon:yes stop_codon:yes gene_type:complete
MFENFATAIVQAVGFLGVFGFFIYRLLSEKNPSNSLKENNKNNSENTIKKINTKKNGFFGRKKNVEQNIEVNKKENKKGWFRR